jgi:hypothetical protein
MTLRTDRHFRQNLIGGPRSQVPSRLQTQIPQTGSHPKISTLTRMDLMQGGIAGVGATGAAREQV